MPFAGQPPFNKNPHDTILSADWNQIGTRMDELEALKANRTAPDNLEGPLTIATSLNVGSAAAADDTLHVRGNLRIEANTPSLSFRRSANNTMANLQFRNANNNVFAAISSTTVAAGDLSFRAGPESSSFTGVPVRMTVSNVGNVGIGTSLPSARLHIADSAATRMLVMAGGNANASLDLLENLSGEYGARLRYDGSANYLQIGCVDNGVERMPISIARTVERVGILTGTASAPQVPLHIGSGSGATLSNNSGYFQIGNMTGANLVMDTNEVQARANGQPATLFLNFWTGSGGTGGSIYLGGTTIGPGADFAEMFETENGKKIAAGTPVVMDFEGPLGDKAVSLFGRRAVTGKIRAARKGEIPFGVVTDTPGTLHNVPFEWPQKYLRDDKGKIITKKKKVEILRQKIEVVKIQKPVMVKTKVKREVEKEVVEEVKGRFVRRMVTETIEENLQQPKTKNHDLFDEFGSKIGSHEIVEMEEVDDERPVFDEDGNPVMEGSGDFEDQMVAEINPDFDEKQKYVPRTEREEWVAVALVGQVIVTSDNVDPNWILLKKISAKASLFLIK